MASLPKRCKKYSLGKEIGGAVYVHRLYEAVLPKIVQDAKRHLPPEFTYSIVKFSERESRISFVSCPDFESADEPIVGDIYCIDSNGSVRLFLQQSDPFIYHHKWLFVTDEYIGFDVGMSRSRSITWLALEGIDMKRIGRKSFWEANVLPRLPKTPVNWLSSDEVGALLNVSPCELSHMRQAGRLVFTKLGNAYFYSIRRELEATLAD
jgi:hypothetical protein